MLINLKTKKTTTTTIYIHFRPLSFSWFQLYHNLNSKLPEVIATTKRDFIDFHSLEDSLTTKS